MSKIILHCGLHKTGTTAIQRALATARSELRSAGVIYPDLTPYFEKNKADDHHLLFHALADSPRHVGRIRFDQVESHVRKLVETEGHPLLFSSESINRHQFGDPDLPWLDLRRQYLQRVKNFFAPAQITPTIVLRRPDDFIESLYKERIRNNTLKGTFLEFARQSESTHLRFLDQLNLYEEVFGSCVVMWYEDLIRENGLVANYLDRLGISYKPPAEDKKRVRESLTTYQTLFKAWMNPFYEKNSKANKNVRDWLNKTDIMEAFERYDIGNSTLWPSREIHQDFLESKKAEVMEIIERFGGPSWLSSSMVTGNRTYVADLPESLKAAVVLRLMGISHEDIFY